jgi:hypothetical protein
MKQVLGLIYLPAVSRSVSRVKEFRRCADHDNLLAYDGRALSVEEFNKAAPKVMGAGAMSLYGVQPIAKLVEIEVAESAPVDAPAKPVAKVKAKPVPVINLPKVTVEPSGDGFVLVNYEGDEARYMGASQAWETDVSLVIPFATEDAARAACPGVLVAEHSLSEDSGASPSLVESAAPSEETPAEASAPDESVSPVVDPKNIRVAVQAAQASKRAAKAARNATAPKKVTPPPAK